MTPAWAGPAPAAIHGVADEGVAFRAVAEAIARGAGVPARSVSRDEAPQHLGAMAHFAQVNNPTSSARTRALLHWQPTHASLLEDLATPHYFAPAT
ncbi:MAG TPA: hypothetical protein VLM79_36275 [Kofleriaceae bacterium]|nr:hypothetical protein [Kofleriaceae bacterium]